MKSEIMRRTDIALRALRQLEDADSVLQATEFAEGVGPTAQFIPRILMPMVRAGWILSESGQRDGYRLATDLSQRSLIERLGATAISARAPLMKGRK